MDVWRKTPQGQQEFIGGLENWQLAAETAFECSNFIPDDEDEQISDEPRSCYNCRYRRWTVESFVCLKGKV